MKLNERKEVRFDLYCPHCNFKHVDDSEYPCAVCMNHPTNDHTPKPVKFSWDRVGKKPPFHEW